MPDTIKTIGAGQDYADPILWAAAVGNLDDGNRQVGEVVEDTDVGAFWRPNQSWPNGGLLRGNVELTGEPGQGITLRNDGDATRFCLSPSSNLHFQDFHLLRTSGYNFQGMKSNVFTRVIMPERGNLIDPNEAPEFYHCVVQDFLANAQAALISPIKFHNSLSTGRLTVKDYNTIEFVNSISVATDWILGPGTYDGVDALVTNSVIRQNANTSEFGSGSSGYTVNYDATNDFVNFAGGDYRLKTDSAYAGTGPFQEGSQPQTITISLSGFESSKGYGQASLSQGKVVALSGFENIKGYGQSNVLLNKLVSLSGFEHQKYFGATTLGQNQLVNLSSFESIKLFGQTSIKRAHVIQLTGIKSKARLGIVTFSGDAVDDIIEKTTKVRSMIRPCIRSCVTKLRGI